MTAPLDTADRRRTTVQVVALVYGVVFLLVALLGFLVSGGSMNPNVETAPRVFGLFPVNLQHNLVHLAFGVWGLAAARTFSASRAYCRAAGIIYLVLAGLGLAMPDLMGLMPIGGNDVWLHLLLAVPLLVAGFAAREVPAAPSRV